MDIISLDQSNFIGLSANYPYDNDLEIDQNTFFSEQNINISVNNILKDINDNKINSFSNVFLTGLDQIKNNIVINKLDNLEDEGFSTYFGVNALGAVTPASRFWDVDEPDITTNVAGLIVSGTYTDLNNRNFFDVELITEKFCKISHENDGIIRYLTVDYSGNLSFCKNVGLDALVEYSPQIFYYVYSRDYDYIILIKNINDICKFISYDAGLQDMILVDPLTGSAVPYSTNSILRVRPRNEAPNNTKLFDPWLSYKKDLKTNSQNVNELRSYENIKSNLLLNNEYYNLSENKKSLDLNLLSLKNSSTAEYNQSRANPFFTEDNIQFRDYKTLFTGSNQIKGNDNISVDYETYTTSILLQKDKVTYFHIPQVFFPFTRLNINDSSLVDSGAIAGDNPLKSDKIFKKKGDYKYTSTFGNTIDENSGNFLCSWLSGSPDINTRPVWVDRYFNPKRTTFIKALTSSDYKAIKYISLFDCLINQADALLGDIELFDKPSDLIFEPGTYYAYHHYGPKDVSNFIKIFSKNLVQNNFNFLTSVDGSIAPVDNVDGTEYSLDGYNYAVTNNLSSIQSSNQFTLIFDAYSNNWKETIGYQIVGNYDRDGFGIFNENVVTPLLFFNAPSALYITNTDFEILNKLELKSDIVSIIRQQGLNDIHLILKDDTIRRYNISYSETRKVTPGVRISQLYGKDNDENNAYILFNNATLPSITVNIKKIDLKNTTVSNITQVPRYVPGITSLNDCRTINLYEDNLYLTNGKKALRVDNKIYYQLNNDIYLWKNIGTSSEKTFIAFHSSTSIDDFTIDFDKNLWIFFDKNYYAKYTNDREFILSGAFTDTSYANYNSFSIAEINNNYDKKLIAVRQSQHQNKKLKLEVLSTEGVQESSSLFFTNTAVGANYSNDSFLINFVKEIYPQYNFNIKAKLVNVYNSNDTEDINLIFNLSALDAGYHNFAVRFDSYEGYMHLFVDGQIQDYVQFKPRKYKFSNLANRPFLLGTSSYSYSIPLFNYLKKKSYMCRNLKFKNFYLYDKPLFDFDIMFHTRKGMHMNDIKFDVACGRRNYIEEIDRYFKINPPGSKSTLFNLAIRNTNIKDINLRYALEQRILKILSTSAPAYTKINSIKWIN